MKKNYFSFISESGKKQLRVVLLGIAFVATMGLSAQQTYTFTTANATGSVGPTQALINAAYLSSNLANSVVTTNGIQSFTVPNTGLVSIDVRGASGGSTNSTYNRAGGLGSRMQGEFNLTAGTVLSILVGQRGVDGCGTGGGGGGSYVVANGTLILIAAGGGGGASSDNNGANSVTVTTGTNDNPGGAVAGGTNGLGGNACNVGSPGANHGGGGAGYLGNGATSTAPTPGGGGFAFVNGGGGGAGNAPGGFGGGGGGTNCTVGGGGGGGYSGGAGGQQVNYCINGPGRTGGGGGGSYNAGITQTNTPGTNLGDGLVIIRELCDVIVYAASSSNSLAPAICAGNTLTLSTTAVNNFTWSNGNTTNTTIVVAPTTNTTYGIIGTGSNNCVASSTINVIVNSGVPVLSINASTTQVCLGQTATLTASGALSYSWTNGVTNGASFIPQVTSSYMVTGLNGCGTSTALTTISVSPLQVSSLATPSVICVGSTAAINLTASANSYTWQPGNIVTSFPNLVVSPTVNTVYSVTATNGTCSGTASISVNANPVPTISSVASTTNMCPTGSSTIIAIGGNSYTWTPGGVVSSSIVVSPSVSTLYQVTGDNNFGCIGTSQQVILIGAQTTITPGPTLQLICSGGAATLIASGAQNYNWSNGPSSSSIVVTPTVSSTYTVIGTSAAQPCPGLRVYTVNVFSPTLTVSGPTAICLGNSAALSASGANSYTWMPGNLTFTNVSVSPTQNTTYTISANSLSTSLNCLLQQSYQIVVHPLPTVTAVSSKTTICRNNKVTLTAGGASSYSWNNTSTVIATTAVVDLTLNVNGSHFFTVTATSDEGCSASKSIFVSVLGCNGIGENQGKMNISLYPNPSSGEITVKGAVEMQLELFNELGQKLQSIELSADNRFEFKVKDLAKGVYFIAEKDGTLREKIIVN